MPIASDILQQAAKTYAERHKVYGDNWTKIGKVLAHLFPTGIDLQSPNDFTRFYFLVLIVAKLSRYVNNFDLGGHQDSVRDMCVYAAMLEAFDEETGNGNRSKSYT